MHGGCRMQQKRSRCREGLLPETMQAATQLQPCMLSCCTAAGWDGTSDLLLVHLLPLRLLQECTYSNCMGLGDRVRGIVHLLRVAQASKRVLLIHHTRPMPLPDLLGPSGVIDWVPRPEKEPEKVMLEHVNRVGSLCVCVCVCVCV